MSTQTQLSTGLPVWETQSTTTSSNYLETTESSQLDFTVNCSAFVGTNASNFPIQCSQPYSFEVEVVLGIILVLMTVGTALGNILVILAVAIVNKLQTPSNYLIVSLASSDLLVAILVLPLAVIVQLKGFWMFGESLCNIFIAVDILLCTSSILNLCAISVDRYLVITRPLIYAAKRTPRRMVLMIAIAWIGSALISIPAILMGKEKFKPGFCHYSDDIGYQVYATICGFYIPLFVMLILYGRIFRLARHMAHVDAKQKLSTSLQPQTSVLSTAIESTVGTSSARHSITGIVNPSNSVLVTDHCSPESLKLLQLHNPQTYNYHQQSSIPNSPYPFTLSNGSAIRKKGSDQSSVGSVAISSTSGGRLSTGNCRNGLSVRSGNNGHVRRSVAAKQHKNSESKAILTLGVIMGCFTICWLPFFILQFSRPILQVAKVMNIPQWLTDTFLWLGYFNSFLNPLIYAKFNMEFRTPFKEILCCRCRFINARLRSESYAEQYGLPLNSVKNRDVVLTPHCRRRSSEVYVNVSKRGGRANRRNTLLATEISSGHGGGGNGEGRSGSGNGSGNGSGCGYRMANTAPVSRQHSTASADLISDR